MEIKDLQPSEILFTEHILESRAVERLVLSGFQAHLSLRPIKDIISSHQPSRTQGIRNGHFFQQKADIHQAHSCKSAFQIRPHFSLCEISLGPLLLYLARAAELQPCQPLAQPGRGKAKVGQGTAGGFLQHRHPGLIKHLAFLPWPAMYLTVRPQMEESFQAQKHLSNLLLARALWAVFFFVFALPLRLAKHFQHPSANFQP